MVQSLPPARDITQDDRDDLLIPLASGVQELLFAPVSPFQNRPAFVAGPRPDTGLAGAVYDLTRLNCRLWASRDKSGYSNRTNQYSAEVCGPYLDSLGENPTGGSALPPFTGGQCFTAYSFIYSFRNPNTGLNQDSNQTVTGRIAGLDERSNDGTGTYSGGILRQQTPNGPIDFLPLGTTNNGAPLNQSIRNIQRIDGLPDNCGNPPTKIQPTGTVVPVTPIVPTITVNLPGVGPVTVNIDLDPIGRPVIFAPDIGAEVVIAPELTVNPDIDVSTGGGGGGGGGAPPLNPEVGPPIDSPPGGGGGGDDTGFGEPPEGRIWVGAYVQLLGDLVPFGIIPRDLVGQAALATVVGNASLNVASDSGVTLRSTFTQIRSEWSEHIVPVVGLTVSGIRVKVNPALGYRVYPVSVLDPKTLE